MGARRLGYGGETTRVENRGETTRGETTKRETSWGRNVLLPPQASNCDLHLPGLRNRPFDIFCGMAYYLSFDRSAYLSNNKYELDSSE